MVLKEFIQRRRPTQEDVLKMYPRSYVIYVEDAQEIFEVQRVMYHLFADDMQWHVSA